MKRFCLNPRFASLCAWFFLALILFVNGPLASAREGAGDEIFQGTNLLRISIHIPQEGLQALRVARNLRGSAKPEALATVTEGGREFTNVAVQLKGFTTYQPIDGLPSLTLNFDKHVPKQRLHGLGKISLNNSLQDGTRLHEKFSRELFAAAGVPVPRADFALVTLNGRDLGLYVLLEGYDKDFLRRHFPRADGNLYEGGTLRDLDRPLELLAGKRPLPDPMVQRVLDAAREPDATRRWQELGEVIDMERFISMMAMETILCHSDSYSMNRNNYRLYHDPATDRLVFMPHGMDRVLGTHRSALDLPIVPPSLGLVARAVLSTPEGRRAQIERVGILLTNVFQPEDLCRRVREIDARILDTKVSRPPDPRFDRGPSESPAEDAVALCRRISERAAHIRFQLGHAPELLAAPPVPPFDASGASPLDEWRPRLTLSRPEPSCALNHENGLLHVRSLGGALAVSLRCRLTLPVGSYQLDGSLQVTNASGRTNVPNLTVVRWSSDRFGMERRTLRAADVRFTFEVREARAPEEIELICDLRDEHEELWVDVSNFKLIDRRRARVAGGP